MPPAIKTENHGVQNKRGGENNTGLKAAARAEIAVKLHIKRKQHDGRYHDFGDNANDRIILHFCPPHFCGAWLCGFGFSGFCF